MKYCLLWHPKGYLCRLARATTILKNFRAGSIQARQHHEGKSVNANISLKKDPRTGVKELVINLHWSTANVNCVTLLEKKPDHT